MDDVFVGCFCVLSCKRNKKYKKDKPLLDIWMLWDMVNKNLYMCKASNKQKRYGLTKRNLYMGYISNLSVSFRQLTAPL